MIYRIWLFLKSGRKPRVDQALGELFYFNPLTPTVAIWVQL